MPVFVAAPEECMIRPISSMVCTVPLRTYSKSPITTARPSSWRAAAKISLALALSDWSDEHRPVVRESLSRSRETESSRCCLWPERRAFFDEEPGQIDRFLERAAAVTRKSITSPVIPPASSD